MSHDCPESWAAEFQKWNPLVRDAMVQAGPSHHIIEYDLGGVTVEYCIHCGEMWIASEADEE